MIKKVRLIKTIKDRFPIPIDVFQLEPFLELENCEEKIEFITGGFYKFDYPMIAFYQSDKEGNILDENPVIMEEGFAKYHTFFEYLGYILI